MSHYIYVPGNPAPWRVYTRRGKPSPSWFAFQAYKQRIIEAAQEQYTLAMLRGPIELSILFFRGIPAAAPKRELNRARWVANHIVKRPDLTNYQKACEDALSGIVYTDDSQVLMVHSAKAYAEESCTKIYITEL